MNEDYLVRWDKMVAKGITANVDQKGTLDQRELKDPKETKDQLVYQGYVETLVVLVKPELWDVLVERVLPVHEV